MNTAPVEYCPVCRRVMVDLAEYSASENMAGIDRSTGCGSAWTGTGGLLNLLLIPFALLGAGWKQRRLDRILTDYPYSLYCAGCGHVERRRFAPEED